MLLNLIDKNCAKVILFLAISPGSRYSRKEIKEKAMINNVPLDTALNKLLTLSLLKEEKRIYSLNIESATVKEILRERGRISNLPLKIQFLLLGLVSDISKTRGIKKIILFGSYSKLIFTENSDIDLAVILGKKTKNRAKIEKSIHVLSEKISKKNKKVIQIHFFSEDDLKHKEDPLIKDILRNGVSLTD